MEFPTQDKPVIIVATGLPHTPFGFLAMQISGWAKSPSWFSLEYILEEVYKEGVYNADCRPSKEEDERLHGLAFSRLGKAVRFPLLRNRFTKFNCVIIESPLSSSAKELDRLIQLSTEEEDPFKLIIIEVRMRHKHMWKFRFRVTKDKKEWYVPQSWVEVEEAIRDYDAKAREWEAHYHLMSSGHHHLKRLVLDPLLDTRQREIASETTNENKKRWSPFSKAIEYLLTDGAAPPVVEYRRWRKEYVEGLLNSTNASTKQLLCSNSAGDCTFKYTTLVVGAGGSVNCRACEQPILSTEEAEAEAYVCVSCSLALHKSCAEFPPTDFYFDVNPRSKYQTFDHVLPRNGGMRLHACKSCSEFSYECGDCVFETHLKCRLLPTVVHFPHLHPHPLSLQFFPQKEDAYNCELCAFGGSNCGYYCVICNFYYQVRCAHSPAQLEHEHGGHRHLMNLILPPAATSNDDGGEDQLAFSGDDYLDPDDSWCAFCYKDLNSQGGFYVCQHCPDYAAHVLCISPKWKGFSAPG